MLDWFTSNGAATQLTQVMRRLARTVQERDALLREAIELRAAVERSQTLLRAAERRITALTDNGASRDVGPTPQGRARLRSATQILQAFRTHLYTRWTGVEGAPASEQPVSASLRVMIGTLHCGENEFAQCVAGIRAQRAPNAAMLEHRVFSGLPKKASISTLMLAFQRSDCDLLIKVDADMVLTSPDFVERIVRVFQADPGLDLLSVAITDFFTNGPIQGINAYRKTAAWDPNQQDALFTDRGQVPPDKRRVVWPTFVRDAVHAPDPSPFHAFHFGVHRGLKTQHDGCGARAEEQFVYLEKTWQHLQVRRDVRLALACLGFELALTGRFTIRQLDYTNPALRTVFDAEFAGRTVDAIEALVTQFRAARSDDVAINDMRDRREVLVEQHTVPVRNILVLLPHTKVFGGVNRFFELARAFAGLGVRMVIAQPGVVVPRPDYADVVVQPYSAVIDQDWDAVLCGDAFGGVMLTMPLFRAKRSAVYLLNGWRRAALNQAQIALAQPDVIIANSSYAATQLPQYAAAIVPGGVDLATFSSTPALRERNGPLRVCAYPGRMHVQKRFDDVVVACAQLVERGIAVELHAYDQSPVALADRSVPFVFHGALDKVGVRDLLHTVDVFVCAEEDGGWSNPSAEAMACGVPLICTEAGTLDFAQHDVTALVVPRQQPQAIADALARIALDPELAHRLRSAGLERIAAFGWDHVAVGIRAALNSTRPDTARAKRNATAIAQIRSQVAEHDT